MDDTPLRKYRQVLHVASTGLLSRLDALDRPGTTLIRNYTLSAGAFLNGNDRSQPILWIGRLVRHLAKPRK